MGKIATAAFSAIVLAGVGAAAQDDDDGGATVHDHRIKEMEPAARNARRHSRRFPST